ncbi:MAG: flagellar hook-length control protein FliK [Firmicutes bacterium]|nr:flagellar hook-length control protein FliK [Bacillota bacterium]
MTDVVNLIIDKIAPAPPKRSTRVTSDKSDKSDVSFSDVKKSVEKKNEKPRENEEKVSENSSDQPVEKEKPTESDKVGSKHESKKPETEKSNKDAETESALNNASTQVNIPLPGVNIKVDLNLTKEQSDVVSKVGEVLNTAGQILSGKALLTVNKPGEGTEKTDDAANLQEGQRTANHDPVMNMFGNVQTKQEDTTQTTEIQNVAATANTDASKTLDAKDVLNLDIVKSGKLGDLVMASKATTSSPAADKINALLESGKLFSESLNIKGIKTELTTPETTGIPSAAGVSTAATSIANLVSGPVSAIVNAAEKTGMLTDLDRFKVSFDSEMESFVRDLSRKYDNLSKTGEEALGGAQTLLSQTTNQITGQISVPVENIEVPQTKFSEVLVSKIREQYTDKSEGQSSMKITITPPNLGEINVDLSMKDGILNADFRCSGDTARVLNDSLTSLQKSLADCGIQLGNSSVSSGWQQSSNNDGQSSQHYKHQQSNAGSDDSVITAVNTTSVVTDSRELNMLV